MKQEIEHQIVQLLKSIDQKLSILIGKDPLFNLNPESLVTTKTNGLQEELKKKITDVEMIEILMKNPRVPEATKKFMIGLKLFADQDKLSDNQRNSLFTTYQSYKGL